MYTLKIWSVNVLEFANLCLNSEGLIEYAYLSKEILNATEDDRCMVDSVYLNAGDHKRVLPRHALRQVIDIQLYIHFGWRSDREAGCGLRAVFVASI